jgi:hypothetical protein
VHVFRVHAEVEDVLLRDAHVLEQLPHAVLESGGAGAALVRRQIRDRLVEADVGFFPVENANELLAQRFVTHGGIMDPVVRRSRSGRSMPNDG